MPVKDTRLAVLIDADNISAAYIKPMMLEIARYGNPTIKRIYGDWTKPQLGPWKQVLQDHAITPVQQFGYTTGKNATDSSMIIDAMDILYTEQVDGFCLISSDSDFTRLATRLREAGKIVYGIGEKKTPNPFVVACDRFIFLEVLAPKEKKAKSAKSQSRSSSDGKSGADAGKDAASDVRGAEGKGAAETSRDGASDARDLSSDAKELSAADGRDLGDGRETGSIERTVLEIDDATCDLIATSVSDLADEDGWAFLGDVGNLVNKKSPSFDARNYGFSKMSKLMQSLDFLECELRVNEKNPQVKLIYVRNKEDN